jgi:hypothetical protein
MLGVELIKRFIIIILCLIMTSVIGCSSNKDYISYTCDSKVLLSRPQHNDLEIYYTTAYGSVVLDWKIQPSDDGADGSSQEEVIFGHYLGKDKEYNDAVVRLIPAYSVASEDIFYTTQFDIDLYSAVKAGLTQDLRTVEIHEDNIEKAIAINSISSSCVTEDPESHGINIDVLNAVRMNTSADVLKETGIGDSAIAWAQAVTSLDQYSIIDSKTGEIITDITEALSNGVSTSTLITVGSTQMEIDKAEAINQISPYGTVDPSTGNLVFIVPQIHEALIAGVPQSAFLNAGISKEAVDSAAELHHIDK